MASVAVEFSKILVHGWRVFDRVYRSRECLRRNMTRLRADHGVPRCLAAKTSLDALRRLENIGWLPGPFSPRAPLPDIGMWQILFFRPIRFNPDYVQAAAGWVVGRYYAQTMSRQGGLLLRLL